MLYYPNFITLIQQIENEILDLVGRLELSENDVEKFYNLQEKYEILHNFHAKPIDKVK